LPPPEKIVKVTRFFGRREIASDDRLRIGDSVVLSTAVSAGCRLLLAENFEDGFTWNLLTVVNPFANLASMVADVAEC